MSADDALGLAAGTLTTISFLPQVARIVRLRHADDLSWWMFGIFSGGTALWLGWGIRLGALPVIVANATTLALALAILVLKFRYGRAAARPPISATSEPEEDHR